MNSRRPGAWPDGSRPPSPRTVSSSPDAEAAGARFLVTEDVDDYGLADLASVGISAVNPDLFLAERLTREAYSVRLVGIGVAEDRTEQRVPARG